MRRAAEAEGQLVRLASVLRAKEEEWVAKMDSLASKQVALERELLKAAQLQQASVVLVWVGGMREETPEDK